MYQHILKDNLAVQSESLHPHLPLRQVPRDLHVAQQHPHGTGAVAAVLPDETTQLRRLGKQCLRPEVTQLHVRPAGLLLHAVLRGGWRRNTCGVDSLLSLQALHVCEGERKTSGRQGDRSVQQRSLQVGALGQDAVSHFCGLRHLLVSIWRLGCGGSLRQRTALALPVHGLAGSQQFLHKQRSVWTDQ